MSKKKNSKTSNSKEVLTFDSIRDVKSFFRYVFKGEDIMSHILFFTILFVFFKLILLPMIGFLLQTSYPLTAIVSESMEQKISNDFVCGNSINENNKDLYYWDFCGNFYENNLNITQEEFEEFSFSKGLYRGDVIIVYGRSPENIKIGDVILFKGQDKVQLPDGTQESLFYLNYGPIIHRVVEINIEENNYYFTTKGDNNPLIMDKEIKIPQEDVIGVAQIRIPYLGLINYYFYRFIVAPIRGN
ncbi:MAG: signal peptidase I [Nanoarchaeota archaeon]|nr:signal peptidase I [Nanoarchaeota archaeon]